MIARVLYDKKTVNNKLLHTLNLPVVHSLILKGKEEKLNLT